MLQCRQGLLANKVSYFGKHSYTCIIMSHTMSSA